MTCPARWTLGGMCQGSRYRTLPSVSPMNDRTRLEMLYDSCAPAVHAYAIRHVGPDEADDVLSETFTVAWRRIDVVPDPALPWLLVTAGNVIRNRRRADRRRSLLAVTLRQTQAAATEGVDELVTERDRLIGALDRLSEVEREALLLIAWDGLDTASAAEVARCGLRAFRARLTRARARLAAELTAVSVPDPEEVHP